ncbi:GNAT family N-acetyltransferase [Exiguobacterium antarcticum]|uniref:GNAT family N-acetyltransferase n=1 Tax=Exiguobacterium antarcticum TaxID=132920 RepID=A0ABT6QXX8_9BACL|nr:GNAT family N-acetyltransferase [Exiguobacterium antarcticum]AFS71260.1 GCN5-related N-acetyltransferase [Exiguobacterium antarcticum B7]MDI3233473.1 GNAT family N-acetyltransferase [Exiguobacterium antarcticum]
MITLIKPSVQLEVEYLDFLTEWQQSGEAIVPSVVSKTFLPLADFLDEQQQEEQIAPKNWVTHSTYWLYDGETIVGAVNFRHDLNDQLQQIGGHIGYGIRPSERNKGYATEGLRQALKVARERGLSSVLITCSADNVASGRVIEANGGQEVESYVKEDGTRVRRFNVPLS